MKCLLGAKGGEKRGSFLRKGAGCFPRKKEKREEDMYTKLDSGKIDADFPGVQLVSVHFSIFKCRARWGGGVVSCVKGAGRFPHKEKRKENMYTKMNRIKMKRIFPG